jgi:hypothetical protein
MGSEERTKTRGDIPNAAMFEAVNAGTILEKSRHGIVTFYSDLLGHASMARR